MESIFNKVAGLKEHYGWLLLYIKLMSNVNREIADIYLQYNILCLLCLYRVFLHPEAATGCVL